MIIPPDPEKDPRLFNPSSSTPSLLPPPSDSEADADDGDGQSREHGRTAGSGQARGQGNGHVNAAYGYPFGDDLGLGYSGEFLPPYERPRNGEGGHGIGFGRDGEMRERERGVNGNGNSVLGVLGNDGMGMRRSGSTPILRHVVIPTLTHGQGRGNGSGGSDGSLTPTPTPISVGNSSTAHLAPDSTLVGTSTSSPRGKIWEGSTSASASASGSGSGSGQASRKGTGKLSLLRQSFFPRLSKTRQTNESHGQDVLPAHKPFTSSTSSLRSSSTIASRYQSFWVKYKRYIIATIVLLLLGLGLMIGLLVGFKQQQQNDALRQGDKSYAAQGPAWHDTDPEDGRRNMVWADGSMNLTWVSSRDNPPASDGNMTICNILTPLNASNFSSLVTPYPGNRLWSSTFLLPLRHYNTTSNSTVDLDSTDIGLVNGTTLAYGLRDGLSLFSRGIASSGTIEFVGADAEEVVINGGVEGMIRVDVVTQYGGFQEVGDIMRVCEMMKDGVMGVGIYTPAQTDGKITNPYALDPTLLPSFHVIVRFPPSVIWNRSIPTLSTPSTPTPSAPPSSTSTSAASRVPLRMRRLSMIADHMAVRVGDLAGVAHFGTWNYTSFRGGVTVGYLAARRVWIATAENSVRGRFEVSESLYINSTDSSIMAEVILAEPPRASVSTATSLTSYLPAQAIQGVQVHKRGPPEGEWSSASVSAVSAAAPASGSSTSSRYRSATREDGWADSHSSASYGPASAAASSAWSPAPSPSSSSSFSSSASANDIVSIMTNSTMVNLVNTTFYTTEGYINVRYLAHPLRTELTSWIATNQGEMDISFHPNFCGPFAVRNAWGSIRLPRPFTRWPGQWTSWPSTSPWQWDGQGQGEENQDEGKGQDPLQMGRSRAVVEGIITVKEGGLFSRAGLNQTLLSKSGTTVTGAAYWQDGVNGTMTPMAVQGSMEGRRGRAVVLGGWGDVRVAFDGR